MLGMGRTEKEKALSLFSKNLTIPIKLSIYKTNILKIEKHSTHDIRKCVIVGSTGAVQRRFISVQREQL